MKSFKQFTKPDKPEEFIAFSNAGGREGQYDKFDYTESFLHGQGGGSNNQIEENLNPRTIPQFIKASGILYDPEKSNEELGEDRHTPENIGIPDYHDNGFMYPEHNKEQAKNAILLSNNTKDDDDYHSIIHPYTSNSYNLNNTLLHHYRNGTNPPDVIKSNLDYDDDDTEINIHDFDKLIASHKLPESMTVYSGLHFHPNEHKGKIAVVPSYMSTSLSPHVAKDFGKDWEMSHSDGTSYNTIKVKNILRLNLPKGQEHLFTDNGSLYPGQSEIILPRGMRYQLGQQPTHILQGKFNSHFGHGKSEEFQYHFWSGRILP